MPEPQQESSRDRLLAAATRLFSAQGYPGTSVADIQTAAGMTGGSGALYKHFASKPALLAEVIATHVATMRQGRRSFVDSVPDLEPAGLEPALGFVADTVWAAMRQDVDVLRVLLRDLDGFPDLLEQIWAEIRLNVYEEFAGWLRAQNDRGAIQVADPEATAAVLLASLTYYPILDALIGHAPGDVDAARFRRAWVAHAYATLVPRVNGQV